jgi:hypothetical protein
VRDEEIPLRWGKRLVRQARFDVVRERKVDIVASEKKVIADRNSFDVREGRSGLAANLEQTEVGRAPTDVDNNDVMYLAFRKLSPKFARFAVVLQPAVKCGLRFLQKTDALRKAGLARGFQGKPLCDGIEGGGNGDGNVLEIEWESLAGEPRIPSSAQVFKEQGGGPNR